MKVSDLIKKLQELEKEQPHATVHIVTERKYGGVSTRSIKEENIDFAEFDGYILID